LSMNTESSTPAVIVIPDHGLQTFEPHENLDKKEALSRIKGSKVAIYFRSRLDQDGKKSTTEVECRIKSKSGNHICGKHYVSTSTTSAIRHIQEVHPEYYALVEPKEPKKKEDTSQAKITFTPTSSLPKYSTEAHKNLVVDLIVRRDLPLSAADWPEFQNIQKILKPDVDTPGTKAVTIRFKERVKEIRDVLRKIFEKIESKIGITMDGWSNSTNQPYCTVTAHWIDDDWCPQNVMLSFEWIEGAHTGKKFAEMLLETLDDFKIFHKIIGITTDNGGGNPTLVKELEEIAAKRGLSFSASWQWQRYQY
jgi:hypothetical protein